MIELLVISFLFATPAFIIRFVYKEPFSMVKAGLIAFLLFPLLPAVCLWLLGIESYYTYRYYGMASSLIAYFILVRDKKRAGIQPECDDISSNPPVEVEIIEETTPVDDIDIPKEIPHVSEESERQIEKEIIETLVIFFLFPLLKVVLYFFDIQFFFGIVEFDFFICLVFFAWCMAANFVCATPCLLLGARRKKKGKEMLKVWQSVMISIIFYPLGAILLAFFSTILSMALPLPIFATSPYSGATLFSPLGLAGIPFLEGPLVGFAILRCGKNNMWLITALWFLIPFLLWYGVLQRLFI